MILQSMQTFDLNSIYSMGGKNIWPSVKCRSTFDLITKYASAKATM